MFAAEIGLAVIMDLYLPKKNQEGKAVSGKTAEVQKCFSRFLLAEGTLSLFKRTKVTEKIEYSQYCQSLYM
jgi:hypothetical protein